MSALRRDIRFAFRALAKNPGFAAAAILALAIGIGANTTIFSVTNALLLRPLPYQDPNRLVILWNRSPGLGIAEDWFSTAQYFDIKAGHTGFEQLAIAIGGNVNLTGDGEPERVGTIRVSSNLLPMLGVRPAQGRLFVPEEDSQGRPLTAVLSYGMWARRYGSDPDVIGKSITINGQPYQVIGILSRSFSLPREVLPTLGGAEQAEIVLPLPLAPNASQIRDREDYNLMGKLKPGVSLRQAQTEMDAVTDRLRREYPDLYPPNGGLTFSIVPLLEQVVGDVRRPLHILLASVGLVLLVACANVASLLLARAAARRKEIAVRAMLGAGRARIIRQLLTESILLALCGGGLGVLLSLWSLSWIDVLGAKSVPRMQDIGIDGRVLLSTLLVSLVTGVLFGLVPALRVAGVDLNATLKEAGRGSAGGNMMWGRGPNLRRLLVVSELALSVVLLIGAGLLIRSFARLQSVHPGFNPRNLLTFGLTMTGRKYNDPQAVLATYRQLWDRFEHLPGVSASGGTTALPLTQTFAWTPITIEGRTPLAGEKFINADERVGGGHYFQAMEIPLRRGRFFTEQDTADSPRVAIIDDSMAQQFWPNQDPVGKRIHQVQSKVPWLTIVGVVARVKHDALDSDPRIAFYLPQTQIPTRAMTVVLRSGTDPASLTSAVKKEIRDLDPNLPAYNVRTMEQFVDQSLAPRRFSMLLLGIFAGLALALAGIGTYGVIAYLVSQGSREIGIRIALGATQGTILGSIVRQGVTLALFGAGIGLAGALALTRFMRSLLFGITATDGLTFAAVPTLLILVALLASYVPARRAAQVDPMSSLRCE
ncbi:MAG: ABC transporter permease [Acidobacteriia bacterium]|nr:ABC transporter permease [Terriglobia bacterium]